MPAKSPSWPSEWGTVSAGNLRSKMLEVASLMHDISKIGVPDHILFKPDKLIVKEAELMDLHRNIAIAVL